MSHHKKQEHHIRPYKIAAQSAGLMACIMVALYFAGTGIPAILKQDANELVPFIPFLILPFVGYILTWFRELTGTLILTTGGTILLVFFLVKGDAYEGLLYGLPFILAGALYLLHIQQRAILKGKSA